MVNLTHFEVRVGDAIYPPAQDNPLLFRPRLGHCEVSPHEMRFATLLGYDPPEGVILPSPGSHVIVPRFAAAVSVALQAGLVPYTIPQRHLGQRGAPGGGCVVLSSLDELERAPSSLAFDFPAEPIQGFGIRRIQRMVGGSHPLRVRGLRDFPPIEGEDFARDRPDGSAYLPPLEGGVDAVIVPQSEPCVRAARNLAKFVFVTSTPHIDGTVDLFLV